MLNKRVFFVFIGLIVLVGITILLLQLTHTNHESDPLLSSFSKNSYNEMYPVETSIPDSEPRTCTIFSAALGETVLFGNNEDFSNPDTHYWIIPSGQEQLGVVYFGFDNLIPQGGINEKGLAFDTNGLPPLDLNPHRELLALPDGWIVYTFMREAATVEEVIDMAKSHYRYNWGIPMKYQIFIADATGDAVVISVGTDGELAFTRKLKGDGFLISTNINRANPENYYGSYPCWRYDTARTMLQELQDENSLTINNFRSILDAVHVEGANTNTLYSNIFDLRNGMIYLYYWHQFDEVVVLKVAEEIGKSSEDKQSYKISDLFSTKTVKQANAEYRYYNGDTDRRIYYYIAIGCLVLTVGCLVYVIYYRKQRLTKSLMKKNR